MQLLAAMLVPFLLIGAEEVYPDVDTAEEVRLYSTVKQNHYSKVTYVSAPFFKDQGALGDFEGYLQYAVRNRETAYCLHLDFRSVDWAFFNSCRDSYGQKLSIDCIDFQKDRGVVVEKYTITFSRSFVEKHRDNEMVLLLNSKRGVMKITLPAYYFRGFLMAVDEVAKGLEFE